MPKREYDYLKYWKVVRKYIMNKYNITHPKLDALLFIYSEKDFTRNEFMEYSKLVSISNRMLDFLQKDGLVMKTRKSMSYQPALYRISTKGSAICGELYRKLNGEEFKEDYKGKQIYGDEKYTDKIHRRYILELNKNLRRQPPRHGFGTQKADDRQ